MYSRGVPIVQRAAFSHAGRPKLSILSGPEWVVALLPQMHKCTSTIYGVSVSVLGYMFSHCPLARRGPMIEIGAATQVRSAPALGLGPIESIPGSFPWTVPRSVCTACTLI